VSGPWRVRRVAMATRNATGKPRPSLGNANSWFVQAPGCPDGPHPTRDCGCRVFKDPEAAQQYANTRNQPHEEGTSGTAA
jgi:hypothetical protein